MAMKLHKRISDPETGCPYIERYFLIKTRWFGVYLHCIDRPDWARDPHDHPWNFRSLILRGGYIEDYRRPINDRLWFHNCFMRMTRTHKAGHWNHIRRGEYHAIRHLLRVPTWSLVFVGRNHDDWGFLTSKGHVPWQTYI